MEENSQNDNQRRSQLNFSRETACHKRGRKKNKNIFPGEHCLISKFRG